MNKSRWALVTLLIAMVIILVPARVFASEVCEGDPDPEGGCDEGYEENGQCKCDGVEACTGSCEDRGLCSTGNDGHGVPVEDCSNINGGLGYCFDVDENGNSCGGGGGPVCDPGEGSGCTRTNSCGMANNGSIQCDGSCSVGPPAESLCGSMPIGVFEAIDPQACVASGWVFDPDYAGSEGIEIWRDGPRNVGVLSSTGPAANSRPDVEQYFAAPNGYSPPNRTNSGWTWSIPSFLKDGLPHTLYVYTNNVNSAGGLVGPNPVLIPYGNPQTFTCIEKPQGEILGASCATASGTAIDPQGAPLNIRIYDVQTGVGSAIVGSGTTSGGTFSVPYDKALGVGGQIHNLTAWAQDISSLGWYPLDGAVTPTCNDSQCVSVTGVPASVFAGGTFTAHVTTKNIGTTTWTNDASPHRLGSANPQDNTIWGTYRVGLPGGSISPGGQVTFDVTATAPAPGTYGFSWRMVEDGVEWFGPVCSNASSVTVLPIPPPTATITSVTQPDYCVSGPEATVTWQYTSAGGLPQAQWQMQIADNPGFSPTVYSQTQPGTATTVSTGQGGPSFFGKTFLARVKVWDSGMQPSAWSAPFSFSTPPGPFPKAAFTNTPAKPIAKQPVQFTFTDAGSNNPTAWLWNFGDGSPITSENTLKNPTHTYAAEGNYSVSVQATNANGDSCSSTPSTLGITRPIPIFREVRPGAIPSPGQ